MEKRIYKVAEIEETRKEAEELLSRSLDDEIKERMKAVIEAEAPIRKALLYKRALNSFGLQKVGSRLLSLFEELSLTLSFPTTLDGDGEVVFHKEEKEDFFRPSPSSALRYSYQIPHQEGAACILYILETGDKPSLTKGELYRLFLSEMGWDKSGRAIEELFSYALKDKRIKRSGNGRFLK